ncbi:MAG TPA: hypothetical protein VJ783_25535 [Pirellulales bacterium]|nr:hypothetical protein [Pirellulales bacterium]
MKRFWILSLLAIGIGCGARGESAARSQAGFVDTTNPSQIPRLPADATQGPMPNSPR